MLTCWGRYDAVKLINSVSCMLLLLCYVTRILGYLFSELTSPCLTHHPYNHTYIVHTCIHTSHIHHASLGGFAPQKHRHADGGAVHRARAAVEVGEQAAGGWYTMVLWWSYSDLKGHDIPLGCWSVIGRRVTLIKPCICDICDVDDSKYNST